jgi:hypothetical protein
MFGRDASVKTALGVKLTENEEAEIMAFCSKTRRTPRELLLAYVRNGVPAVTAKDLNEARYEADTQGRMVGCGEVQSELAKAAQAVARAQQLAQQYAEELARLDTWYTQARAMRDPKVPIPNDAIERWKQCAREIL